MRGRYIDVLCLNFKAWYCMSLQCPKVSMSLSAFQQDINRLSPFHSSCASVSRPCRLSEFTPYRALIMVMDIWDQESPPPPPYSYILIYSSHPGGTLSIRLTLHHYLASWFLTPVFFVYELAPYLPYRASGS